MMLTNSYSKDDEKFDDIRKYNPEFSKFRTGFLPGSTRTRALLMLATSILKIVRTSEHIDEITHLKMIKQRYCDATALTRRRNLRHLTEESKKFLRATSNLASCHLPLPRNRR